MQHQSILSMINTQEQTTLPKLTSLPVLPVVQGKELDYVHPMFNHNYFFYNQLIGASTQGLISNLITLYPNACAATHVLCT